MMLRTTIACALIAVVLICPYLCLGKAVEATVAHSAAVGCFCCNPPAESGGQSPQSPDANDPNCLCHGAIMDGIRAAELDLAAPMAIDWHIVDVLSSSADASAADISCEASCHFPQLCSGREICSLICALLL